MATEPDYARRISMVVNEERHDARVEPRQLLVSFLRDDLGLTGTKVGCDTTSCGACTVLLDGRAVKSCTILAVQADGAEISTIEGIGSESELHPMQRAFHEHHALQCGYCTPGMVMAAIGLVRDRGRELTASEVAYGLKGNLCRCTGYLPIVEAVRDASRELAGDQ